MRKRSLRDINEGSSQKKMFTSHGIRKLIQCFCNECKGAFRDPRIKRSHENKLSEKLQTSDFTWNMDVDDSSSIQSEKMPEVLSFVSDKKFRYPRLLQPYVLIPPEDDINNDIIGEDRSDENCESDGDESCESDNENFENEGENKESEDESESFEDFDTRTVEFIWILLFLFKMQTHFKLPAKHIDVFIKFLRIILVDIDSKRFSSFPTSLYVARKMVGLYNKFKNFVACSKCHCLYDLNETINYKENGQLAIRLCNHVEFPNNKNRITKTCDFPLVKQTQLCGKLMNKPSLIFPLGTLKQQLQSMFRRPGFEKKLRHWQARRLSSTVIADIYDGKRWKTFFDDKENELFFQPEKADTHLGITFNLDWFQMFERSNHSTGALYGVINNLPPHERFQPENMLIALITPGPKEASKHQINHYISPFVDQLLDLWDGVNLRTNEHPEGQKIRAALIGLACDLPAGRKLCGHISYISACHWCHKKADSIRGFGGFDDMGEWFKLRDANAHRQNALMWQTCKTNNAREEHVRKTHARWSELLRLPYFDPITFLPIDALHNLFIGDGSWLMKRIWIEKGKITKVKLQIISDRLKKLHLPPDIGRMPYNKINVTDGFVGLTGDEWKNFYIIASPIVLYDLLDDEVDRRILNYFVRAITIFTCKILTPGLLEKGHRLFIKLLKLIEEAYGWEKISPNLHLSLHIAESCLLYGPLSSYWCYGFERMNGILGALPNSHRQVEPEIMSYLMNIIQIDEKIALFSDNHNKPLLEQSLLLLKKSSVGSLAASDREHLDTYNLQKVLRLTQQITARGDEAFPGEMLTPKKNILLSKNLQNHLVEYYQRSYNDLKFRKPFEYSVNSSIPISLQAIQYGRLRISGEVFGSVVSGRSAMNSYILARFADNNNNIDTYPGQVHFYFKHTMKIPNGEKTHYLAYVRWYKPAQTATRRFHLSLDNDDNTCLAELWSDKFYEEAADCIIPIQNILGRFIPGTVEIKGRKKEYFMAVVPINRRFYL